MAAAGFSMLIKEQKNIVICQEEHQQNQLQLRKR